MKNKFVVVPLDEGDEEVLAIRNNTALMAFIDECAQRARTMPTTSLAQIKAEMAGEGDDNPSRPPCN